MDKKLSSKALLIYLIKKAYDPFCTADSYQDIKSILFHSNNFHGMNYLYLAESYIEDDFSLFKISQEQAIHFCKKALKEDNPYGYYCLYKIYLKANDLKKARIFLRLSCSSSITEAYLEMGKNYQEGFLFSKDYKKAENYYLKALYLGNKESYFYLLLLALKERKTEKAYKIYSIAEKDNYRLPGVAL